ncbi:MAG: hypothetical protein AB1558_07345 [Thermodesulfobacteriota bacterium]
MLALGWTGVLRPPEALSGFSSNAVIAMIAVMVMGRALRTFRRHSGGAGLAVGGRRALFLFWSASPAPFPIHGHRHIPAG